MIEFFGGPADGRSMNLNASIVPRFFMYPYDGRSYLYQRVGDASEGYRYIYTPGLQA